MINTRVGVSAGDQIATYHENQTKIQPVFPDTSFHTKGMLRRLIESQCYDIARKDQKYEDLLAKFEEMAKEVSRLQKQRLSDQETILQKNNEIKDLQMKVIDFYSQATSKTEESPLRIAG